MVNSPTQGWRERLAVQGWRPESFLIMGRIIQQLADRVTPEVLASADETLKSAPFASADWERAYSTMPQYMTQLVASFEPAIAADAPAEEHGLGSWLRDTLFKVERLVKKMELLTDKNTGKFSDEAMQTAELKAVMETLDHHADAMLVELKAVVDNFAALMSSGKPMSAWLAAAQAGDDEALLVVLSLNRWLSHHPGINRRIQQAIAQQDHQLLHRISRLLKRKPVLKRQAIIGLIFFVLWEAGLKRLTYKQIRGFLKAVGLHRVPSHQALERYGERLGLKKYVIERGKSG
jgi:hypothetical protein